MELGLTKSRKCSSSRGSLADYFFALPASRCLSLPFSLLLLALPALDLANETVSNLGAKKQLALEHFSSAVQMRTSLESKPKRLRSEAEYLKVINKFRSVYYAYPASSKADESLIAVAELYQALASDLKDPKYFDQAVKAYDFLEDQYPNSPYCPDALFTSAEIRLNDLGDPRTAQEIFKDFLKRYPQSNKARNARARLDDLREQSRHVKRQAPRPPVTHVKSSPVERSAEVPVEVTKKDRVKIITETLKTFGTSSPGSAKGSSSTPALVKNRGKPVRIKNIRFWGTEQSTRFVIDT